MAREKWEENGSIYSKKGGQMGSSKHDKWQGTQISKWHQKSKFQRYPTEIDTHLCMKFKFLSK